LWLGVFDVSVAGGAELVEQNFAVVGPPSCISESLENILSLKVGVVRQNRFDGMAAADHTDDHAYGDPDASDARFSSHHFGPLGDAVKVGH
jgi:hypothetical protein